jgi:hypothetical protein
MSIRSDLAPAIDTLTAIVALRDSPGFKVLMAKYEQRFNELGVEMDNLATPAARAEIIRQVRGVLRENFAPDVIANDIIKKASGRAVLAIDRKQ